MKRLCLHIRQVELYEEFYQEIISLEHGILLRKLKTERIILHIGDLQVTTQIALRYILKKNYKKSKSFLYTQN